ncbi:MAG TPA: TonB-dependent receptor [Vicinamibacteria bacterium]|nr:TonB-dependent receptor [Vicinamibacteria bacterium]
MQIATPSALHVVLASLVLALSPPARSQETQAAEEKDKKKPVPQTQAPPPAVEEYVFVEGSLPELPKSSTIVTKLPLERRLTPNNVGFVTERLAREQFDRVLGDSLVNVSNVNVQTQNGVTDFFYIRGFDSFSSGLVLFDGAPEPEASLFQMYNVELVEVLKGPGGFLYGSNPLAGAVNLVRKQPVPAKLFSFGASGGSHDNYEGYFDWNYGNPDGKVDFRVNGLFRDQGSYRDGKEGHTGAINPAVTFRLGDRGRLNLNFEYLDLDYVPDSGIPVLGTSVVDVDPATNYQTPFDASAQELFRFQADYEWRASEWLSFRDKFYQKSLDWQSGATLFNGAFPAGPTTLLLVRLFTDLEDRQTFTGNQLEAVLDFSTGSVKHSVLTGFEISRFADEYTLGVGLLPFVDALNPVDPGTPPVPLPGQAFAGDSRAIVAAPYVIDQIQFGSRLNVLLGGRYDGIDFSDDVTGFERDDSEFSPMAGVLVAATPDLSLYANYSRAFSPPSARVVGELEPERGTQIEGGVKKRFSPWKTETTFAVYQLERDNIPIPDDNGFTQQAGDQRSRGFEVDIAAEPSSTFRTFFSYAFNDAELTRFAETLVVPQVPPLVVVFDRSGNEPAFAPEHVLNLWASKDVTERFGVGVGARYVSSQFIAEDNAFELDSVFTLDAMAFYRFGDLKLRVNLKNITDREYFMRGFGAVSVIPAAPFTAYFGFDYQM